MCIRRFNSSSSNEVQEHVNHDEDELSSDATEYESESDMNYDEAVLHGHKYVCYRHDFYVAMEALGSALVRLREVTPLFFVDYIEYAQQLVDPDNDLTRSLVHHGLLCVDPACQATWMNVAAFVCNVAQRVSLAPPLTQTHAEANFGLALVAVHLTLTAVHESLDFDHDFCVEPAQRLPPMLETLRAFITSHCPPDSDVDALLYPVNLPFKCSGDDDGDNKHRALGMFGRVREPNDGL